MSKNQYIQEINFLENIKAGFCPELYRLEFIDYEGEVFKPYNEYSCLGVRSVQATCFAVADEWLMKVIDVDGRFLHLVTDDCIEKPDDEVTAAQWLYLKKVIGFDHLDEMIKIAKRINEEASITYAFYNAYETELEMTPILIKTIKFLESDVDLLMGEIEAIR